MNNGNLVGKARHRPDRRIYGCVIAILLLASIVFIWKIWHANASNPAGYKTLTGSFKKAAVVTNAIPCAAIGKDVLKKGGNAVDAMIAAMLCDGVTMPQSMGIGGGFFMIIYNRTRNDFVTIDARETAPARATVDMFSGNKNASSTGGLAVGVPGEMKGLWTAYQRFGGGLPWEELVMPTVKLCEEGIPLSRPLATNLVAKRAVIENNPEFRELFTDSKTGRWFQVGDTYKHPKLALTLRIIAKEGGDTMYTGRLASDLVKDIQNAGGIITEEDLINYEARVEDPMAVPLSNNFTLYSMKPPASGTVLAYILRILGGILPAPNELITTQRITEAFKFAYALRGELGDHNFVNVTWIYDKIASDEFINQIQQLISDTRTWNDTAHYNMQSISVDDHGTANLAVLSENGDAVVSSSTVNLVFGSKLISKSTGILLNDEMDDFSSPNMTNHFGVKPSETNFIQPGKRMFSSMCPSIITDHSGNLKLLIGGSGGTQITTAVAITVARNLFLKESIRDALDHILFHHQLVPMKWVYFPKIPTDVIEGMKKIGHIVQLTAPTSFSAVSAIAVEGSDVIGVCDHKRVRTKRCFVVCAGLAIATVVVSLSIFAVWKISTSTKSSNYQTLFGTFQQAVVVSSAIPCATIGKDILRKGGNAVDAMIATMFCDGVTIPYATGIGGGFLMIIYNKTFNNFTVINARESAPSAARVDMFHGNSNASQKGGLSIAIPGTMKGLWTAYQTFGGKIAWNELVMPTIELCERGIPINEAVASALLLQKTLIYSDLEFRRLFVDSTTGLLLRAGDTYKNLKLARTLRVVASGGGDILYKGELAGRLANDIQKVGGIISKEDLLNYRVLMEEPFTSSFDNGRFILHSIKPPGSGAVLAYILRVLSNMLPTSDELVTTQRMTEAFKYAYAARADLGDPNFVNVSSILEKILSDRFISDVRSRIDDYRTWNDPAHYEMKAIGPNDKGTSNLAVFSEDGDAVVATGTLNTRFGSEVISKSTGIILNNEMDDFSSPNITNSFGVSPFEANLIEPGKRPMSSMCPSIVTNHLGEVKLLIGGAGGTRITTAVAISTARNIFFKENIRVAMDHVLFHHQLLPMVWKYSFGLPRYIIDGMKNISHSVKQSELTDYAVVSAIEIDGVDIYGSCDRNRPGQIDGY